MQNYFSRIFKITLNFYKELNYYNLKKISINIFKNLFNFRKMNSLEICLSIKKLKEKEITTNSIIYNNYPEDIISWNISGYNTDVLQITNCKLAEINFQKLWCILLCHCTQLFTVYKTLIIDSLKKNYLYYIESNVFFFDIKRCCLIKNVPENIQITNCYNYRNPRHIRFRNHQNGLNSAKFVVLFKSSKNICDKQDYFEITFKIGDVCLDISKEKRLTEFLYLFQSTDNVYIFFNLKTLKIIGVLNFSNIVSFHDKQNEPIQYDEQYDNKFCHLDLNSFKIRDDKLDFFLTNNNKLYFFQNLLEKFNNNIVDFNFCIEEKLDPIISQIFFLCDFYYLQPTFQFNKTTIYLKNLLNDQFIIQQTNQFLITSKLQKKKYINNNDNINMFNLIIYKIIKDTKNIIMPEQKIIKYESIYSKNKSNRRQSRKLINFENNDITTIKEYNNSLYFLKGSDLYKIVFENDIFYFEKFLTFHTKKNIDFVIYNNNFLILSSNRSFFSNILSLKSYKLINNDLFLKNISYFSHYEENLSIINEFNILKFDKKMYVLNFLNKRQEYPFTNYKLWLKCDREFMRNFDNMIVDDFSDDFNFLFNKNL